MGILCSIIQAIVSASIDFVVENSNVSNIYSITLISNVISIFYLFLLQIENHNAKTTSHVCQVALEINMVDALVTYDGLVLDVGQVFDVTVNVDEIDVSVCVGHKEFALALVVADSADAYVGQTIDFVEDVDGIVFCVIVEQFKLCGGINLVANGLNTNHFLVGQVSAPITDRDTVLGDGKD